MLITCGLIFLELKKRYSVLLGLADNLLATNQEKTSLMQDSIIDTADNACSGKIKYFSIIRIKVTTDVRVFGYDRMEWGGVTSVE